MNRTTRQLLELMPIVADYSWYLYAGGSIRDEQGACPICALANEVTDRHSYTLLARAAASEVFGIEESISEFIRAADFPRSTRVRKTLMAILNPGLRT